MPTVCRFRFRGGLKRETIETQLALAIIAAESVFGNPRVRLTAGYFLSDDASELVLDISTEEGEYIARVFTGFITRCAGEDGFSLAILGPGSQELDLVGAVKFWIRWVSLVGKNPEQYMAKEKSPDTCWD